MKYSIKDYADIKEKVDSMSLHELLGTVLCPNVDADVNGELPTNTGSVMFHPAKAEVVGECIKKIKADSDTPKLFCADLEAGAGYSTQGMTRFPSFMASGVAGGGEMAYKMGVVCANEAKSIGLNWTFSPCVDIVFNHNDPIVSTRSAGDTPEKVLEVAGAYMKALQDNGIAATLKHFPGDGLCDNDQHLTTPENPLSMEEWYATYGKVYKTLIDEGVKAIMPGHISLPAYDVKDEKLDMYPPADLSKRIMTDLLRGELGFDGIIISDAINMGGFCGYMNYFDACATFLESGGDVLLFAHLTDEFEEKMKQAIDDGRLSMETLRNRAYRVMCFAREMQDYASDEKANLDENAKVGEEITEKACVIERDRDGLIPFDIKKDTKLLHLVIQNNYSDDDVHRLTTELSKICDNVEECIDPGCDRILEMVKSGKYDLIVCTVGCQRSFGYNAIKLHGAVARNMMMGWTKYDTPVIFVNYGHPWFGDEYKAIVDTLINTYGCTNHTASAVVKKIIGQL